MMSVRAVLTLSSFLVIIASSVRGEITFPKCTVPSLNWTFNEDGFSPCRVAANLEASCVGSSFNITPITDPRLTYAGPKTRADSNPCVCSSVTYSLVSACALCQDAQFNSWDIWITNCSSDDISIGSYKFSLPAGVGVPAWAYLNITTSGDRFDPTAASAVAAGPTHIPDSTIANAPTGGSGNTGSQGGSKKSSNAGAIAGGVVGGVVGLALIVIACLWFLRRRRRLEDPGQFSNEKLDMAAEPPSAGLSQSFSGYAPTISSQPPLKLYDPNDPSTFPGTPVSSNYQSPTPAPPSITSHGMTSHNHSTSQFSGGTHTRGMSDGTYKGIPEV